MKKKIEKSSFETMRNLFEESWKKHKIAGVGWMDAWKKTREDNGWGMDEFDLALDKYEHNKGAMKKIEVDKKVA